MTSDVAPKGVDEKFCSSCGNIIKIKAEICPKCGVRQRGKGFSLEGRNRILAAFLAFFFGGIGVHKFYLGQIFWGIIYFIFCWTFIPVLVSFIEFILLLCTSDEKFDERFNK